MKRIIHFKRGALAIALLLSSANQLHAYTTATPALGAANQCAAFDTANGVWYLGQAAGAENGALAKVGPFNGSSAPTVTSIGSNVLISGLAIPALSLSQQTGTTTQRPVFVTSIIPISNALGATQVLISSNDGTTVAQSVALNDAAGAASRGITGLAASPSYIFAAVKPNGVNAWGVANSGIAVMSINDSTLALTPFNARTGAALTGGAAQFFDVTDNSPWININPTHDVQFINTAPAMAWSQDLQRLFVGIGITTEGAVTGAGAALSTFRLVTAAPNITLTNVQLTETLNGFNNGASAATSNIVGLTGANALSVTILKLAVMKTSTGKYYIIVNGGLGLTAAVGNKVFALPLVGGASVATAGTEGSLARVLNVAEMNLGLNVDPLIDFSTRATGIVDLMNETCAPAMVGGQATTTTPFPFPIAAANSITNLQVVGDTVFASTAQAAGANDQPGIYYSQAIFTNTGAIKKWTDWAKATPNTVAGVSFIDGRCFNFAVDGARGNVWTIPNATQLAVQVATWTLTDSTNAGVNPLSIINSNLGGACYSSLTLDQSINNIGNVGVNRLALFGGTNKVVMAIMSTAVTATFINVPNVTSATWDATQVATLNSTGLSGAGAITCLGYTANNAGPGNASNYIMAGSNQGLFVFCTGGLSTGAGLTAAQMSGTATNNALLSTTFSWYQIPSTNVSGEVRAIKTIGNYVYVLTRDTGTDGTIADNVYSNINTAITAGAFATAFTLIATSGTGGLPSQFYDMDIVGGTATGSNDQVAIATNDGVWITTVANGTDQAGLTQATALWTQIGDTDGIGFPRLTAPLFSRVSTGANTGFNPSQSANGLSWQDGSDNLETYLETSMRQLVLSSSSATRNLYYYYNNDDTGAESLGGLALNFYSDGGRRFFAATPDTGTQLQQVLTVYPCQVGIYNWNLTSQSPTVVPDAALNNVKYIYWISNMGAGYIMMGTDIGVLALQ